MIILYAFGSLLGALTTVAVLSPFGWPMALLCAPLGGSALTLMIAAGVYVARTDKASLRPAVFTPRH